MKNQLDKAIRRVMAARHAEHRRAAVLVILALLTILSVSWRLHQVGIAMTDDEYSCGYEEHVHSDACYTEVLICGYEDGASETPADSAEEDGKTAPAAHSHTADCYQRVLTCTLPEHTHTLECLADITADVETPADWDEQSEGVSSFWSDAMTEIAQRQLGYTESAKNFTVDKALGETLAQAHHYTRYGDWYGNPYGSWDVMFVAFCQHYAGIPEDVIPQCASLLQLRTELENAHPEYITPGGSEATPGDIVLYTNAAGEETIGIVTAYDGANLTVVSGAVDGAVAAVTVAEADVTNTIRVLDAYGVYAQTGASDGSEELSFDADAILARDGAVAYGYKQNNSTTYAKNKVIWYCIKLNLGSGDVDKTHTLTVVDKIPDGMKLATDNNSLSSYRIAADLDAKPGNKYTGNIKSPSENIYSLVLNGVTYWSIDTSVSGQLTIQVLPNTLKNLIVPSKTTDHYVEIRYALRLDDATAWNERTLEEKTYTNRITQSTALS